MGIKRFRISTGQAILMIAIVNLGAVQLYAPSLSYAAIGRNGWMLPIGALAVGTVGGWLLSALIRRYSGKSLFECLQSALGKPGAVLGTLLALSMAGLAIALVRAFSSLVSAELLPQTPISVLAGSVLLVSAYAAFHGIEALVRLTQIFTLLVVPAAALFILAPLILPLDPGHLLPIRLPGAIRQWPPMAAMLLMFPGFILLSVIAPALDRPRNVFRAAFWGTFFPALVVTASIIYPVMTFGWPSASRYARPFWEVLAVVPVSVLAPVQRLAYFMTLASRFVGYISLSGYLYSASAGLKNVVWPQGHAYRGALLFLSPTVLCLSLWPSRILTESWIVWSHIALGLTALVVPLVLLTAAGPKRGAP